MARETTRGWIIVIGLWLGVASFMTTVILDASPFVAVALAGERTALGWLSSVLLTLAGGIAATIWLCRDEHWAWLALGAGFFAASLDERFMLHESLKSWILFHHFDGSYDAMGVWGDLSLLVYPFGTAVLLVLIVRRQAPCSSMLFCAAGVALGVLALALDLFGLGAFWLAAEEVMEIVAEAALVSGLLLLLSKMEDIRHDRA